MKKTNHLCFLRSMAKVSLPLFLLSPVVEADETYQYFRFTPGVLRGQGSENSIQLAEFEMLFEGTALTGATATNPGGSTPPNEAPPNVVDGSLTTKWLDFNKAALVLDYGSPVTVDG
jgi:hypothetical protein